LINSKFEQNYMNTKDCTRELHILTKSLSLSNEIVAPPGEKI